MDLTDINKLETDAKTLKERVSHQTSELLKLKVNQDAAYWDLEEKLVGVEADHERLQQNMLEVQMQHNDLSAQHQEELRKRHETLNKVVVSRERCDALEEHAERVRASLQRAAADRAALATAYDIAAQRVQAATAEHARVAHESQLKASALADKLRKSVAYGERMESLAILAQRQVEKERGAAHDELRPVAERLAELRTRRDEQEQRAVRAEAALQERDHMNTELMREMEKRAAQSNAVAEHEAQLRAELQKEIEARGEALAAAVARGDAAAHEVARAQAVLAAAHEHDARRNDEMATLVATVQNQETMAVSFKQQVVAIIEQNEKLHKEIGDKDRECQEIATRVQNMQRALDETRAARDEAALRLRSVQTELDAERVARANDAATAIEQQRAIEERSAAAAALAAAAAERTLVERADTVARLKRDVAGEAEARARCDTALQAATKAKEDIDAHVRSMDTKLQAQEKKLAERKTTIRKMGIKKERLQGEIRDMQRSIDNVRKEVSRKPWPTAAHATASAMMRRELLELADDNAMDALPSPVVKEVCGKSLKTKRDMSMTPVPGPSSLDDSIFNFLSDDSMDANPTHVNPVEPNKKLARGQEPPAQSLNEPIKRRRSNQTQEVCGKSLKTKRDMSMTPVPGPSSLDDSIFNILSDDSMDANPTHVNPVEPNKKLARGQEPPAQSLNEPIKRRRSNQTQEVCGKSLKTKRDMSMTPVPGPSSLDDSIFNFLSDDSMDANPTHVNPVEPNKKLARGQEPSAQSLNELIKRCRSNQTQADAPAANMQQPLVRSQQITNERARSYIPTKRRDIKPKK